MAETNENFYCALLAERIQAYFAMGIHPGSDVRGYIESTFSHPTRRELENILQDPENCERDTLLELIYFPDLYVQIELENLLEQGHFQKNEEKTVLRLLMSKKPVTAFCYPHKAAPVRFATPECAAEQFIIRLDISKKADRRLLEIIHCRLPQDVQLTAKVMIRNARFECYGNRANSLKLFFLEMNPRRDDYFEYLKFMLHILEMTPSEGSLQESFARLKRHHRENIRKAEQVKTLIKGHNVETMILQGARIPSFNTRNDLQKVIMIDEMALALYGQSASLNFNSDAQ